MKKSLFVLSGVAATLAPVLAFAQVTGNCGQPGDLGYILCKISLILNTIVPILIVLAVVFFIWGVVMYVIGTDEEAKKKGKGRMIMGLIALLVIVSIWGLVSILKKTFGVTNTSDIQMPCIESPGVVCP